MDSFEWNKIIGAVLFALLVGVGLRIATEILFEAEPPETPGYVIATAAEGRGAEPEAPKSIALLLMDADPDRGGNAAKKCQACHTFAEGEPNKVGPNLFGVVMRPIASHEGYQYSEAMHAYAEEAGDWTYEHLNTFLHDPAGTVPGTKMTFAGLKDDSERANVIAYLRTLAANPVPLPEPEAAAPAEGEAAAEGAAAEESTASPEDMAPAGEEQAPADGAMAPAEGVASDEAATEEPSDAMQAPEETAPADEQQGAMEPSAEQETAAADQNAMAPATEEPAAEQETAMAQGQDTMQPATEEPAATAGQGAEEPAAEQETAMATAGDQATAMPAGDVEKGKNFARRCLACHAFEEGGANKVGPHLFGVFDRPVASVSDYAYSDAMKAFSEDGSKHWDAETLNTYLADPSGVVPGTKMIFPGVKNDTDRANLIAYLASLH